MNSTTRRGERLEQRIGANGPCALCERRAAEVERSPVMRHGFVENPGDTYTLNWRTAGW